MTVAIPVIPISIAIIYLLLEAEPIKGYLEVSIPDRWIRLICKALIMFALVFIILNVLYPFTVLKS